MSDSFYSEINFHITRHTKSNLPIITRTVEDRLYNYLIPKIIKTPGGYLHAVGGIGTHIHIGVSLAPNILVSDWIGKMKGGSSRYINHEEVQLKPLEWQRGYGVVLFGTRDHVRVVAYIRNQKEHHRVGTTHERPERVDRDDAKAVGEGR